MDVFGEDIILSVICLESNLVLLIQHVNIIEHLLCAGLHHAKKDTPVFMPHMAQHWDSGGQEQGVFWRQVLWLQSPGCSGADREQQR